MALEVAPEIWLEIAYILPPPALANLSLANHRFREISKPPLFAHFEFHPYALELVVHNREEALLPEEAENFQEMSERLQFWCSDAIAPHVRTCMVSPWRNGYRDWKFSASPTPHPTVLQQAFLRNLERFKGLRELSVYRLSFQYPEFIASSSALNLGFLGLCCCDIFAVADIDAGDNKLKVKRLSLEDNTDETPLPLWLAGFDPNALEELELGYRLPTWWRYSDLVVEPSFPNVRILSLRLRNVGIQEDLHFLAYFPALTNLSIHDWNLGWKDPDRPPSLMERCFLKLKTLHAASELLPLLLTRKASPSLEKLSVEICTPSSLVSALRTIPTESFSRTISSLVLSFDLPEERPPHVESDSTTRYLGEILEFYTELIY
ncbi:hypothetical protein C8F01DRAFT_1376733 [Mycena amicta]|nr:hypothetical protein C8F01DRAFT_1376733 [Mycena amicta]